MSSAELGPVRPPPYALQIPALWRSADFQASDFVERAVANFSSSIDEFEIDTSRIEDQLRTARTLALSLGISNCYTLVRKVESSLLVLTMMCAIVRVTSDPEENNIDLMVRTFKTADGMDFEVLPMMSILTGSAGELLRAERVIPESTDGMMWSHRMISYGILHPRRDAVAMLIGTSPNVDLEDVGEVFDAIAKTFFWVG